MKIATLQVGAGVDMDALVDSEAFISTFQMLEGMIIELIKAKVTRRLVSMLE